MGDQVKQAFQKLKEYWNNLSPKLKKLFIFGLLGLLAFAVALTVFLNAKSNELTALFPGMERAEASEVYAELQDMGISAQMNAEGMVLVPTEQLEELTAQLSMKHYPKTTLTYDLYPGGGSLTATDADRRALDKQQLQDRLQGTINTFTGIKSSIVNLNLTEDSGRVWETSQAKNTGFVSVTLDKGVTLTPEQVSGIKYCVANSVREMNVADVKVVDAGTSIVQRSTEDQAAGGVAGGEERLNFERQIEEKIEEKALRVLTLIYTPEEIAVSATVTLDYNKMLKESKTYQPTPESPNGAAGVLQHEDGSETTQATQPAEGVPGEEDNTDLPTYNNQATDGQEVTDSNFSRDYVNSYILEQINKDQAELKSATIAVTLTADLDDMTRQSVITSVSKATGIAEENVSVENFVIDQPTEDVVTPQEPVPIDPLVFVIGGAVLLLLILILIIALIISSKRKKKQRALLAAAQEEVVVVGDQDNAEFNLQQELEERKRQLRELSQRTTDDAIADEVREFAHNNPEITANLLRAWMKEEIE